MKTIELRPGERVELKVYGDPRYGPGVEGPTVYRVSTPSTGQDDGWGGNLIVELIDRYGGIHGDPQLAELSAIGGSDDSIDFGDPEEDLQVDGSIIRIAERYP